MTSEVVTAGSFRPSLELLGHVEVRSRLTLVAPTSGRVVYPQRFAAGLRTGVRVSAGEPLFEIDNESVRLAVAEATIQLEAAQTELESARQGVVGGFRPAIELQRQEVAARLAEERLRSAKKEMAQLKVTAPSAGRLHVEEPVAPLTDIAAGTVLGEIASETARRVEAVAAATDLGALQPGLEVECLRPGQRDVVARGVLRELARRVGALGTLRAVVEVTEDYDLPAPGEGVDVRVLLPERLAALSVPSEAVLLDGGVSSVFTLDASGEGFRATRRFVQLGARDGERVEVIDGLREGERVAVRGSDLLSESAIAVLAGEEQSKSRGKPGRTAR